MIGVYLLPMMYRPLDFIFNIKKYLFGMTCFILMMPTYVNVMSIYSMSNLHDISWGNRPSVAGGINTFSQDAKRQEGIKNRYQIFRVNFLSIWVILNVAYILLIETYISITS